MYPTRIDARSNWKGLPDGLMSVFHPGRASAAELNRAFMREMDI